MWKLLVLTVVAALLAVMGWLVWSRLSEAKPAAGRGRGPAAVAVELADVTQATVHDVGVFSGSLLPQFKFIVAPKVPGRLKQLMVNTGDRVDRDQLIALLEDAEYAQEVAEARAQLQVAQANLKECETQMESARREFDRVNALFKKQIAPESDLDAKRDALKVSEAKLSVAAAQVAQREAALKGAEVRLAYTQIRATWEAGGGERVVGERFVDEGAMLKANDPIVSILDIGVLVAVINVIERDYSKLRIGQEATITTDAFPGRTFRGKVVRIAPLLLEASRKARVEVEIRNEEGLLKPGMFIRAEIEFSRRENATVVPQSALVRREDKRGVFLADLVQKKARFQPVVTGVVDRGRVEVLEPALSGRVAVMGQHLLEDGTAIVVPGMGDDAAAGGPPPGRERERPGSGRSGQKPAGAGTEKRP